MPEPTKDELRTELAGVKGDRDAALDRERARFDALMGQYQHDTQRLAELETRCAAHEDTITELRRSADSLVAGYREQIDRLTTANTQAMAAAGAGDVYTDVMGNADDVEHIDPKILTALQSAAKKHKRTVSDELAAILKVR